MPWLLRAEPWDPATGAVRPVYYSDAGFVSEPVDQPADTYWERRIDVSLSMRSSLFAGSDVGGESQTAYGAVTLANGDGALDGLAELDWDGRLVEIRFSAAERPRWSDFAVVFAGTCEQLVPGDALTLELRDRKALADEPLQPTKWLGTGGAEGPETFKDRRKPLALGVLRQIEPLWQDEANLILAYADGPCGGVLELCDQGRPLVAGPDYPTREALRAADLSGWGYGTCDALGLVRLQASPERPVTLDVLGRSRGAVTGAAALPLSVTTVPGRRYALKALVRRSAGSLTLTANGTPLGAAVAASGRVVLPFVATDTSTALAAVPGPGWSGAVEAVQVVEWLGRFADLAQFALDNATSLEAGDFLAADLTALNDLAPQALSLWFDGSSEITARQAVDQLAIGIGAWWGFDPLGRIRMGRFDAPAAVPDFTFTERDLLRLEPRQVDRRLKTLTVGYGRRWRVLSESEIAGLITGDARAAKRTDWRTVEHADPVVAQASLLAREERVDLPLDSEPEARAEAQRRVALHGPRRAAFDAVVPFTAGLRVGLTVRLQDRRYGLSNGRNFVVMELSSDTAGEEHTLSLWG
ncbi:hypothetical protein MHZ93_18165 [Roseomonas sp. ACRSG]|nr:hypothetical protein [Roseomonas sp. ACRSG]